MNLLDTSTTWVDIFWMSPNLAKEAFQECIVFLMMEYVSLKNGDFIVFCICRATTRPPRPSSTAECLRLIACLRGEQASAASWEPRPPFEVAEMD